MTTHTIATVNILSMSIVVRRSLRTVIEFRFLPLAMKVLGITRPEELLYSHQPAMRLVSETAWHLCDWSTRALWLEPHDHASQPRPRVRMQRPYPRVWRRPKRVREVEC